MKLLKKTIISFVAGISLAACFAPTSISKADSDSSSTKPSVTETEINSYIQHASLKQKIGQMFVSRTPQTPGQAERDVHNYNLGGLIVYDADMQGLTQEQFKQKMARYQKTAEMPLLIGVDQEGGLVSRLTHSGLVPQNGDQFAFPRKQYEDAEKAQKGSGMKAVTNYASETATLLRSLGINWNYAPDADYSDNPNSFIYQRGFGGVMGPQSYSGEADYIKNVIPAWQHDGLVAATLKHFPGYGDAADTHTGFAHTDKSAADVESKDMLPFKAGIDAGADSVMVTHVIYDKIDPDYPASLSKKINRLLRDNCHFNGVIVTDALEMGAITNFAKEHGNVPVDVLAVEAGNDMIMTSDYATGIPEIEKAVKAGTISESQINASVKRILEMKNKLHLLSPDDLNGNRKPADPDSSDQPTNPDQKATKDFKLNKVVYNKDSKTATITGTIPDSAAEGSMVMTLTDANTKETITTTVVGGQGKFSVDIPIKANAQKIIISSSDPTYKSQTITVEGSNTSTPSNPSDTNNSSDSQTNTSNTNSSSTTPTNKPDTNVPDKSTSNNSSNTKAGSHYKKSVKTVMHQANIYTKRGKKVGVKRAYQKVTVLARVTIKGKNYYRIGHDKYVLVSNVTGVLRKLKHNAQVYNNKGHKIGKLLKKNHLVRTYGSAIKMHHNYFYRIGRNKYVKTVNFKK